MLHIWAGHREPESRVWGASHVSLCFMRTFSEAETGKTSVHVTLSQHPIGPFLRSAHISLSSLTLGLPCLEGKCFR